MAQHLIFYTGRGDDGTTDRLGGRERVRKTSLLMETVGTLDEAAAAIGMARALSEDSAIKEALRGVQERFIGMMAHISATESKRQRYAGVGVEDLHWLEGQIAGLGEALPPLRAFVLPGASPSEAALHLARTIVRRAERRLLALMDEESGIDETQAAFLNRLSSLLFVCALRERQALR